MTTVADFIKDTLGTIQVINPSQSVSASDMQTGIRFLNRLMTRLEASGISMGWRDVESPDEEMPIPPEAELGVMYSLGIMLAPQYGVDVMPAVAAGAQTFLNDLMRDQMVATPIQPILGVPMPDGWSSRTVNASTWYVG